jgi:hypothetical protein
MKILKYTSIAFLLLAIFFVNTLMAQVESAKNDWEKSGFKGKIRQIQTFLKTSKNEKPVLTHFSVFNSKGFCTTHSNYSNETGQLVHHEKLLYGGDDNLLAKAEFYSESDSKPRTEHSFYNQLNQKVKLLCYDKDNELTKETCFKYDSKGNLQEQSENFCSKNYNRLKETFFSYDSENLMTSKSVYQQFFLKEAFLNDSSKSIAQQELVKRWKSGEKRLFCIENYKYDNRGNCILVECSYPEKPEMNGKFVSKYDKDGNEFFYKYCDSKGQTKEIILSNYSEGKFTQNMSFDGDGNLIKKVVWEINTQGNPEKILILDLESKQKVVADLQYDAVGNRVLFNEIGINWDKQSSEFGKKEFARTYSYSIDYY